MAAALGSFSNTTYGSNTNTTVTAPTGVQAGDYLLLLVALGASGEAPDPTPPSGFTAIATPVDIGDTFNLELRSYGKVADSGDAAAANFTVTHTTASSQAVMLRITGVDADTPLDATPTINDNNGATTTWTGLTTVTNGAFIVAAEVDFADNTNDTSPPSGTTPTFTELLDVTLTYVAYGTMATAGATGDKTHVNNNGGGAPWGSVLFAFRPGVEVTDPPANTVAPVVSGTTQEGQTLTVTPGTWSPAATSYTYQWQRRPS